MSCEKGLLKYTELVGHQKSDMAVLRRDIVSLPHFNYSLRKTRSVISPVGQT